jgi:hypothetical protein
MSLFAETTNDPLVRTREELAWANERYIAYKVHTEQYIKELRAELAELSLKTFELQAEVERHRETLGIVRGS